MDAEGNLSYRGATAKDRLGSTLCFCQSFDDRKLTFGGLLE